jgi:hypothetical protein
MLQRLSLGSPRKIAACSELDAAREIQRSLLPQKTPAIKKYSIGFRSSACYEVGGDYLGVFALPSGEEVMIVADVAGKGPRRGSCRGPRSGSVANRNACIKENCAEYGPRESRILCERGAPVFGMASQRRAYAWKPYAFIHIKGVRL